MSIIATTDIEIFLLFYSCSGFYTDSLVECFCVFDNHTFDINERHLFQEYFTIINRICN